MMMTTTITDPIPRFYAPLRTSHRPKTRNRSLAHRIRKDRRAYEAVDDDDDDDDDDDNRPNSSALRSS
jgi:hypothetical protein